MARSADFPRESRNQDLNVKSPNSHMTVFQILKYWQLTGKKSQTHLWARIEKPTACKGLERGCAGALGFTDEETEVQREVTCP